MSELSKEYIRKIVSYSSHAQSIYEAGREDERESSGKAEKVQSRGHGEGLTDAKKIRGILHVVAGPDKIIGSSFNVEATRYTDSIGLYRYDIDGAEVFLHSDGVVEGFLFEVEVEGLPHEWRNLNQIFIEATRTSVRYVDAGMTMVIDTHLSTTIR